MQFGLFTLVPRADPASAPRELLEETYELVDQAEADDVFDSVWIAEHHFSNYGLVASPLPFAVKLAGRTRRVRLVTAVLVLPFYQPLRLAEDVALTDHLTDGRLTVGIGRGYQPYEFARFGRRLEDSRERFGEALEILLLALRERTFSYQGAHFSIPETSLALPPLQAPHPPIVVAATTPESLGDAARRGFGVVTTASWNPIEEIARSRRIYDEQLGAQGLSADAANFSCMRFVYVTDSRADMVRAAEQALWITRISAGFRNDHTRVVDGHAMADHLEGEPSPEVFAERMIFGDVETCIEKVARLQEVVRPTRLICNVQLAAFPHDRIRRSLERFAERVAPHFSTASAVAAV